MPGFHLLDFLLSTSLAGELNDHVAAHQKRDNQPIAEVTRGTDRVCLTSRHVARVSPAGKVLWLVPFKQPYPIGDGGLTKLQGGDLLAFRFAPLWNSGVDLIRLSPATGKVAWSSRCAELVGVAHSAYRHAATIAIAAHLIRVTSEGSAGTFIEILYVETGRQIRRTVSKRH
jgi:hypothetical protein